MKAKMVFRSPRHERGVTLLIALIMLIAMTLTGLALFRQVGTGVIVARNLTFRESAALAADQGVEAARAWLRTQGSGTLEQANKNEGYYAGWCNVSLDASNLPDANSDGNTDNCSISPPPSTFAASGYNWVNAKHLAAADGNQVDYIIHRLCAIPGGINALNQQCVTLTAVDEKQSHGTVSYGDRPIQATVQPYFRITTRVVGPMNTVVYTQAIIY